MKHSFSSHESTIFVRY